MMEVTMKSFSKLVRVVERRKRALARLEKQLADDRIYKQSEKKKIRTPQGWVEIEGLSEANISRINKEIETLKQRI